MIEKIGGLWFKDGELVAGPEMSAIKQQIEKHGVPPAIIEEAVRHNALLQRMNRPKRAKNARI